MRVLGMLEKVTGIFSSISGKTARLARFAYPLLCPDV